ncbi:hypothetical protein [Zoogloea sp. 1C4]|uniref:hypothetical protein n=1 Tax=Zoogloea sp. 1C4 TaxID=2570190 RepID=UPI0012916DE5|nr:hypothetical protein [Zoogloea sp. 1C4]
MDRLYASHTSATPPALPAGAESGYPRGGAVGQSPTQAGPYWFHMITESLRNVIVGAGLTPDASDLTLLAQAIAAMVDVASSGVPTGAIMHHRRSTAPAGWVELRSGTIGSSGSGATVRANADTASLFELIWTESDNTAAPIQDSSGLPTTRGASAAADFAAGKRLPLDDMRAAFLRSLDNGRGVDGGRVLGSHQDSENKSHTHSGTTSDVSLNVATGTIRVSPSSEGGDPALTGSSGTVHHHTFNTDASGGAESRPLNRAYLCCIKL